MHRRHRLQSLRMPLKKRVKEVLVHAARSLFDEIFHFESRNIFRWRQNSALQQTGQFIEAHLPLAPAFETRYALYDHLIDTQRLAERPGLICEFGVATGKSINYLARRLKGQTIFGFDSFDGLPEDWRTNQPKGTFRTTLPRVEANVELVPGLFQETLGDFLKAHPEPALFLHLDADLYSSTRTILEAFEGRITQGTVLLFDEFFNYPGWQMGEFKAFSEFATSTGLHFEYLAYNGLGTQLALLIT